MLLVAAEKKEEKPATVTSSSSSSDPDPDAAPDEQAANEQLLADAQLIMDLLHYKLQHKEEEEQQTDAATSSDSPSSASPSSPPSSSSVATSSSPSSSSAVASSSSSPAPSSTSLTSVLPHMSEEEREQAELLQKDLKYVIGLLKTAPLTPPDVGSGARTVVMTSKGGKKFKCTIPHPSQVMQHTIPAPEPIEAVAATTTAAATTSTASAATETVQSSGPAATGAESAATAAPAAATPASPAPPAAPPSPPIDPEVARKTQQQQELKQIPTLIRSYLGSGCFTKQKDYWTYEVCPFKSVRQYHRQSETQAISIEFSLGTYTAIGDEVQHHHVSPGSSTSPSLHPSYSQLFEGGSTNRQSKVTFLCNKEPQKTAEAEKFNEEVNGNTGHLLVEISEPKPFHYEFEIRTRLLCKDAHEKLGPPTTTAQISTSAAAPAPSASSAAKLLHKTGSASTQQSGAAATGNSATPQSSASSAVVNTETGRLHTAPRRRRNQQATAATGSTLCHTLDHTLCFMRIAVDPRLRPSRPVIQIAHSPTVILMTDIAGLNGGTLHDTSGSIDFREGSGGRDET